MTKIEMFTKPDCIYCVRAKTLFEQKDLDYVTYDVLEEEHFAEMKRRAPEARTVPQIFIVGELVGGFTDLDALDKSGQLDSMLQS